MNFDPATEKNVRLWLEGDYDTKTKEELQRLIQENPQAVIDAFYTHLSFGTGGMRGIVGIGSNRMNRYTVRAATQAVANYLKKQRKESLSFFIGYDSRIHSREFAEEAAKVLAGNNIRVFLCADLRPTPYVSFGCRHLQCDGAIMITASHNPPEYNGFKVYWKDGGQVLPPHDRGIIEEYEKITSPKMVQSTYSLETNYITEVKDDLDTAYIEALSHLPLYPEEDRKNGEKLRVIYTSLHGTGITLVPKVLENWGFRNVKLVESQSIPDGHFPTVKSPNPEDESALEMGIAMLRETDSDLLIATDPDADRVGVAIKHKDKVRIFTGNEIACICLEHICRALQKNEQMPAKAAFIKTIATTELFRAIVEHYGKTCFDTLIGFKYISELIELWEKDPKGYQFIFAGEESYGYLFGKHCRDKDAIISSALICEVALQAKLEGKTLVDLLHDLHRNYGLYVNKLASISFPDTKAGKEQLAKGMDQLRKKTPKQLQGVNVIAIEDYLLSEKKLVTEKISMPMTLPKSDVLVFWLEDHSKLIIRPSGTEPKMKIYCGVSSCSKDPNACEKHAENLINEIKHILQE